jgi:glycosyltransferase involved in cell wall biosynthesis
MKVAIVCDWLANVGGAERVVLQLHELYPSAPIYTSQCDPNIVGWLKDADVRTLWLQHLPKTWRKFLPVLRAWSFSHLDLSDYDLVISSSSAEAKSVKTGPNTTHVWYCHAPTHYYWMRYDAYLKDPGFGRFDWLARIGLKIAVGPMRRWDRLIAQKPNYIVTNSNFTKSEIKKYYGRDDAKVIHPPVDIDRFKTDTTEERHGFVVVGRQTPYKKIDLAVKACTKLNLPLTVIGNGPQHDRLVKLAGPSVEFVTGASDQEVAQHLGRAEALIFPGVDDFGITAVEALAAGVPVIAYNGGGALDYMVDNKSGLLFNTLSADSLAKCLHSFMAKNFETSYLKQAASRFSETEFTNNFKTFINSIS